MFIMALHFAVTLTAADCGYLCSEEAVGHYARLNARAALTRRDSERAAFLVRTNDGELRAIVWQAGQATEASHKGPIPARCVAIIHTHPTAAPHPSRRDLAEAQRIQLPIVVITPDSVTVARTDGAAVQLFGRGWTRVR
jgi:proteasome lid subunit RPN8/RPN11